MMLSIRNALGDTIQLYGVDDDYQLVSVSGLDPVRAQINMSTLAGQDGATFVSAKLNNRNIVVLLAVNGDIESNRLYLYNMLPVKSQVRVLITTDQRDVYINGYVEYITFNAFEKGAKAQISILCPDPYFVSQRIYSASALERDDQLVFQVENTGDAPTPFEFILGAEGSFSGLTLSINDAELIVEDYAFVSPSMISIDMTAKTASVDGVNLVPYLSSSSEFLQLPLQQAELRVVSNFSGVTNVQSFISWHELYGGL